MPMQKPSRTGLPLLAGLALALAGVMAPAPQVLAANVVFEQQSAAPSDNRPAVGRCAAPSRARGQIAQLVKLINAERRARGLPALRPSAKLERVAHAHACDNAAQGGYSHVGSDGSDLGQRLRRGGYKLRMAAENTGWGFDTPEKAMNFWMHSPHHRDNILAAGATEIGVGLADGARPAWVINFARPR
ncbi:CAP domain-containing protein [Rhodobacter ferrooxidans]|uniref:SCP-like extracellular n=1 Tax=Rhodobacter ferrooxidans TaxID=371731 RepID=C8S0H2_9RHOB|nr:CAP domain-containing protein [Rhodobacter sp. SW2]EEW25506.1 SCP-like extracellular [Rhodobacter sp. SW2]